MIFKSPFFIFYKIIFLEGSFPTTGSPTVTLLRLHPSYWLHYHKKCLQWYTSISIVVHLFISNIANSRGVTGGVYKTQEHIHRGVLIHDY